MKTVFPTDEIAHLWAHQTQDNARNPGGNFYFNGKSIFSYGSHFEIARLSTGPGGNPLVLMTPRTYSNTTAKHICDVRQAIRGMEVLTVPNFDARQGPAPVILPPSKVKLADLSWLKSTKKATVEGMKVRYWNDYNIADFFTTGFFSNGYGSDKQGRTAKNKPASFAEGVRRTKTAAARYSFDNWAAPHLVNLRYLLASLDEYVSKMKRSRTTDYVRSARGLAEKVAEYLLIYPAAAEVLDTPYDKNLPAGEGETLLQRLDRARTWDITAEERAVFVERSDQHAAAHRYNGNVDDTETRDEFMAPQGKRDRWLAGTISRLGYYESRWLEEEHGTRLQLLAKTEQVHTSKGAYVPVEDARKLLRLVRLVKMSGKGDRPANFMIGHYHVSSITAEGNLVAGCHVINNVEIERFAASVGWSEAHDEDHQLREVRELLS